MQFLYSEPQRIFLTLWQLNLACFTELTLKNYWGLAAIDLSEGTDSTPSELQASNFHRLHGNYHSSPVTDDQ